jgi:hypothetical protein
LQAAASGSVFVGLPAEKVGGAIYDNGETVISVGASHEYGVGVPRRSFLRVPFDIKKDDMDKAIAKQFQDVAESGKSAKKALGLVGVTAVNISKGAFTSRGYGTWPDISATTKKAKGSSQPLVDTGTLKRSVTYAVRGV